MSNTIVPRGNAEKIGELNQATGQIIQRLRQGAREAILNLTQAQGVTPEVSDRWVEHRMAKAAAAGDLSVRARLYEPRGRLRGRDQDGFQFNAYLFRGSKSLWLNSTPERSELSEWPMDDTRLTKVLGMMVFTKFLRDAAARTPFELKPENGVPYDAIAGLVCAEVETFGPESWQEAIATAAEHRYPVPEQLLSAVQAALATPAA